MLKVGMIGAGIIGKNHAEAIKLVDGISLVAVTDIVSDRANNFGEKYNSKPYTDYKEMIHNEKLDIALINLPHGLHKEASVFCAENGLHIVLEKPMANTSEECFEIMETVKKNKLKIMIGHIQRYIAENIKAKELINSGKYGELVSFTDVRNIDYFTDVRPKWFFDKKLAGGGIVMNYGAHSLDKIKWISDLEILNINGKVSQKLDGYGVEGDAQLLVHLSNDISGIISYCGYLTPSFNETVLYLTRGVIKLQTGYGIWVSEGGDFEKVEIANETDPFVLMWQDFYNSIIRDEIPPVDGEYAMDIIKNIETVYKQNNF